MTPLPIRRGYVTTPFGQLHYRAAGTRDVGRRDGAGRTLVLLHQTASSSVMFERLMTLLADRYHLIAPDTPGFGGSDPLPGAPTIARYAEALAAALQRLEIPCADLFGHHSGASIAVQLATDHPGRVARLALCGPPYLTRAQLERLLPTVQPLTLDESGAHLAAAWRRVRKKDPTAPLDLAHREAVLTLQAGPHYPAAYHAVFTHDFAGQLGRLEQPTLVMAGPDDTIFDCLAPAFAALRHGEQRVLARGGTYVCDREPELVADTLRSFFTPPARGSTQEVPA